MSTAVDAGKPLPETERLVVGGPAFTESVTAGWGEDTPPPNTTPREKPAGRRPGLHRERHGGLGEAHSAQQHHTEEHAGDSSGRFQACFHIGSPFVFRFGCASLGIPHPYSETKRWILRFSEKIAKV